MAREALIRRAQHRNGGRKEKGVQLKPETKHFQLFCWEFSIASFRVRSTEAGEREGENGGREERNI